MITSFVTTVTTFTLLPFGQLANYSGENVLVSREISLENRHPVESVNEVFKDNILLNMAYLRGTVKSKEDIDWDVVKKPFVYEFKLNPGESFAYHPDVLPEYSELIYKTGNARFNAQDGFKNSGYLYGDGVCHLASLMYWAALDAGLNTEAPTNHNFMTIPEISGEYGVSIYYHPGRSLANAKQNLYIGNNQENPVTFRFEYSEEKLKLSILEN